MLSFYIPFLSVEGCSPTAESSFYFLKFLAGERFYLFEYVLSWLRFNF